MKNLLLIIICLFSARYNYAQVKGDPQMKGKLQQPNISKSSSKLDPELKSLNESQGLTLQSRESSKQVPSSNTRQNLMQIKGDKVLVDFTVQDNINAAKAALQKAGVTITAVYGRVISGFVSINALPQIEAITNIRYAKPSYKPRHQPVKGGTSETHTRFSKPGSSIMPVMSQGDTAQLSFLAREKYHVNGNGVRVGILSDSYNNLGSADVGIEHGELPGKENPFGFKRPVQVLKDLDSGGTDEGRQMIEILHDVAPGSDPFFYTAFDGEADFAQGIQKLADNGCKIIGDDVFYYDEPFFQDGIIAQSVDIAKKRGVTYFSSAGNYSVSSYESDYRPTEVEPFGPGNGTAHNFSAPGDAPRYAQPLYLPPDGSVIIGFQWDQSSFAASGVGATTDFDIYLTDIDGNIVAASFSDNIASGEPLELFEYKNNTTNYTFFLTIVKFAGPDVTRLKYILYNDALFYLTDPAIPGILSPTLVGHTKAGGAISTGAAWYFQTPAYGVDTALVTYYSAEGGVPNYFDIYGNRIAPLIRKKPDIVAPDGGNVSFSSFQNQDITQDADSYPNFFGTSAAVPHAAGVAALMIDAQRLNTITPDQIKGVLSATASDMDDSYTDGFDKGFDFNTGYGLINAEKSVGKVKFPNMYVRNLKLKPLCSDDPHSVRNWEIVNPNPFPVDAKWFVEGTNQNGSLIALPGETTFTTNTVTFHNFPVPNFVILSWKDNFDFTRIDAAFSNTAKCGRDEISDKNSDRLISAAGLQSKKIANAAVNVAEVYPNPSSKSFNLYLLLANNQSTNIELYSVDGRKLQSKIVNQSNGMVNIDVNGYKPGIYLLNVKQGNFFKTIKLIKE